MGVKGLWGILSPAKAQRSLKSLSGQTVAVDLSIWVCEDESVRMMQGVVAKPYLRNLFFRVSHLLQLGISLVVVVEGQAPKVKWDEMARRQHHRGRQKKQQAASRPGRSQHTAKLKECCELLRSLGVPYVAAQGEAEAMCACLNAAGIVDGCITDDGDAFLYGARVVYKNFTMNAKTSQDSHVEMYCMDTIEARLGLTRSHMLALGLLLGCDYVPKGVPGIGVETALKLLEVLRGKDILARFDEWRRCPRLGVERVEQSVRDRALAIPDFPFYQVISEFLNSKESPPVSKMSWQRPAMETFQAYVTAKLEWEPDYSLDKVLPLVTLWDQRALLERRTNFGQYLRPARIVKKRICQGQPVYEVEWKKPCPTSILPEDKAWVTLEEQGMFQQCFPQAVEDFLSTAPASKQQKKRGTARKAAPTAPADLVSQMSMLNVGNSRSGLHTHTAPQDLAAVQHKEPVSVQVLLRSDRTPIVIDIDSDDSDSGSAAQQESSTEAGCKTGGACLAKETLRVKEEGVAAEEEKEEEEEQEDDEVILPLRLRLQAKLSGEKLSSRTETRSHLSLPKTSPPESCTATTCSAAVSSEKDSQPKEQQQWQQDSQRNYFTDEEGDGPSQDEESVILAGNADWSWKRKEKQTDGFVSCWDLQPRHHGPLTEGEMSNENSPVASNLSVICEMIESQQSPSLSHSSCRTPQCTPVTVGHRGPSEVMEGEVGAQSPPHWDFEHAFVSDDEEEASVNSKTSTLASSNVEKNCSDQSETPGNREEVQDEEEDRATTAETPVQAAEVSHDFSHVNLSATLLTPNLSSVDIEQQSLLTTLCRTPRSRAQSTPSLWHHNLHHTPRLCSSRLGSSKNFANLEYGNFVIEHSLLQTSLQPGRDASRLLDEDGLRKSEQLTQCPSGEESTLNARNLVEDKSKESVTSFLVSSEEKPVVMSLPEEEDPGVLVSVSGACPSLVKTSSAGVSESRQGQAEPDDSLSESDMSFPEMPSLAERIRMKMAL